MRKLSLCLLPLLTACSRGDAGASSLTILIEADASITEGLEAGTEGARITDGWQVRFDDYIVGIGELALAFATDPTRVIEDERRFVVDLPRLPAAGLPLWSFERLDAGRWQLAYSTATAGASRDDSVSTEDFEAMITSDWTHLIRGTMRRPDGVSCPPAGKAMVPMGATSTGMNDAGDACYPNPTITFEIGAEAETIYGPCALDGQPGFSVAADRTQSVSVSIHGDHIFFNGFPEGEESSVTRLAQWLADCDLDLDGRITNRELAAIELSELAEIDDRFELGSPPAPLATASTYVRAQLQTQGFFRTEGEGEGRCPSVGVR